MNLQALLFGMNRPPALPEGDGCIGNTASLLRSVGEWILHGLFGLDLHVIGPGGPVALAVEALIGADADVIGRLGLQALDGEAGLLRVPDDRCFMPGPVKSWE